MLFHRGHDILTDDAWVDEEINDGSADDEKKKEENKKVQSEAGGDDEKDIFDGIGDCDDFISDFKNHEGRDEQGTNYCQDEIRDEVGIPEAFCWVHV